MNGDYNLTALAVGQQRSPLVISLIKVLFRGQSLHKCVPSCHTCFLSSPQMCRGQWLHAAISTWQHFRLKLFCGGLGRDIWYFLQILPSVLIKWCLSSTDDIEQRSSQMWVASNRTVIQCCENFTNYKPNSEWFTSIPSQKSIIDMLIINENNNWLQHQPPKLRNHVSFNFCNRSFHHLNQWFPTFVSKNKQISAGSPHIISSE